MKRQKARTERVRYGALFNEDASDSQTISLNQLRPPKSDHIVAQIQEGDSLQAICIRYNCSLSELKRLNRIEKDIEIHARSTLRIPVTPHTLLLDTLPGVHTSGNSSPKHAAVASTSSSSPPLLNNSILDEKLIIASVSNATPSTSTTTSPSINDIILGTRHTPVRSVYRDNDDAQDEDNADHSKVLLLNDDHELDENVPQPRTIPVPHRFELTFNGTDWNMSWVCLFVCILLACVAIPLIYVFFTVEHQHELHNHQLHGQQLQIQHDHHPVT